MPTWPTDLGQAIFFFTSLGFIAFYFITLFVLLLVWLWRGRPLMDNPETLKSINDRRSALKMKQ